MPKGRLEAFSDGVIAVIITIMVLELKTPHGAELAALEPLVPLLAAYAVSFAYVGIYWSNHHHLLHAAKRIDGRVLLANLHLLFWLALVPFATGWVGENRSAPTPTALYGGVLFASGVAFLLLKNALVAVSGRESAITRAVGRDIKPRASLMLYGCAIVLSFVKTWIADALYVLVALMWLIPDRRLERASRAPTPPTRSSSPA
jgi:uncharacterized membrane protein